MERILYFDCFSGISGDMTLGALVDLGVGADYLKSELEKLHLDGYHIHIEQTSRQAITGTDVDVHLHEHEHQHEHEYNEEHAHGDGHHDHGHHHHGDARNLYDITDIIEKSGISPRAKELAAAIFTEIAKAEGKVHGKSLDEVHFHEVGAVDSIVDIVGAAICLDALSVSRICCSPIREGRGFVRCQHGTLPVPVPAVTEMLADSRLSLVTCDFDGELVTPTGFGILKATASCCGNMPPMKVEKVGYGFGKKKTGSLNALRVFLGTAVKNGEDADIDGGTITVIEANVDDETGEILGYVMDRMMDAGALDVFYTPVYMKKNRPGIHMTVLCRDEDRQAMADILLRETSTIGLRFRKTERMVLPRREETAETPFGPVRVKCSGAGSSAKEKPEYEDCVKIAREQGIPLKKVYRACAQSRNGGNE